MWRNAAGPHRFVAGSHRSSGRIFSRPYTEDEIEDLYGRDKIVKLLGPKGTTFLEDTWGIHKGDIPTIRSRLLLQVEYSIMPVLKVYLWTGVYSRTDVIDRYSNRLFVTYRNLFISSDVYLAPRSF